MSQLLEKKGKIIPCGRAKDRKGIGANSKKSGRRNQMLRVSEAKWRVQEGV